MKIYIVYGNHRSFMGISDLTKIIYKSYIRLDCVSEVVLTKDIVVNEYNILVEEFSGKEYCKYLRELKMQFPKTYLTLFITEFPTGNTFNLFEKQDKLRFKLLNQYIEKYNINKAYNAEGQHKTTILNKIKFKLEKFALKNRFKSFKAGDILDFDEFRPTFLIRGINYLYRRIIFDKNAYVIGNLFFETSDLYYFFCRFNNLKILISENIFDFSFVPHQILEEKVLNHFNINSIEFPYYIDMKNNKYIKDKAGFFIFSGHETAKRKAIFKLFENVHGMKVTVNSNTRDDAFRQILFEQYKFSLQISRYENSPYSSPTRTLSSLELGLIPVDYESSECSLMEQFLEIDNISDLIKQSKSNQISNESDDFAIFLNEYYKIKKEKMEIKAKEYNDYSFAIASKTLIFN